MDDPYSIRIEKDHVLIVDPPDYEVHWSEQQNKLIEISAACQEAGSQKVLVRGTTTKVKLTRMQMFEMAKEVARRQLVIAFVLHHDASVDDERFFENVANNRGAPVAFFTEETEARNWLRIDPA